MLYTNLQKEILKVYTEDIAGAVNATAQTITDTRKAKAMNASQYASVGELLTNKETFVAQCNDIFKSNANFDTLAREMAHFLRYDSSREFIGAIAGGLDAQKLSNQLNKISADYLGNPVALSEILAMVTDDIVKMPAENKNKWTMTAQHLKDSLTKAIDTTGPKNTPAPQPAQQQQQQPSVTTSDDSKKQVSDATGQQP